MYVSDAMSNLEQVQEDLGWESATGAPAESETHRRIRKERPGWRVLTVASLVALAVGIVAVALAVLSGLAR